ncbi:hypothetical protein [Cryobacterium sp. TMS1-13-1]|uniref:hypothetical protein n=1 Tax=Cryobacterium sp. TMS1-13-1 TaxID=1259220 RepID=UPI00106D9E6B|nr:hypothetical protein [Cryobacterium sp. TMS1-13-1]TFD22138.1 hypothetical protein E3T31_08635 [Cryobacterium sp. TMS1-13-1]
MTITDQTDIEAVDELDTDAQTTDTTGDTAETFPREYVVKLRDENAKYRQRAGQSDDLAKRLHLELVRAGGRLADATDLPFDDAHLTDPEAMTAAVDALLTAKPHLANRKPTGDIGQGASVIADTFSLSGLLRSGAK